MAAPRRAPPLMSVLLPRSQAGDFMDVGAIDADIVQLAVLYAESSCNTLQ